MTYFSDSFPLKRTTLSLSVAGAFLALPQMALAHGTIATPPSRIYQCYQEGPETPKSPACQAAVEKYGTSGLYNWNGIRQGNAAGNHQAVVPDGELCSGGDPTMFGGMDLARNDWVATHVAPGNLTLTWNVTAAHATSYYRYYITRNGYDPLQPLKWSDLELIVETPPSAASFSVAHTINLPARTGKHVIYTVWQRSDSTEAFYACTDVDYGGTTPTPTPAPTPTPTPTPTPGGACATTWSTASSYNAGAVVSYSSVNYVANYWTKGQNPSTNNGPANSGQPWTSKGACGSGTPTPTPTPTPAPTPTPTPAPTPTPTPAPTPTPTPAPTPTPTPAPTPTPTPAPTPTPTPAPTPTPTGCTSPQYVDGASYATGAKVQNIGNEYSCTVGGWCSQGGPYAPGVGWAWQNAWSFIRSCS